MNTEKDIIIRQNKAVCVVRFVCNNANVVRLINDFRELSAPESKSLLSEKPSCFECRYYLNRGLDRSVSKICRENINSDRLFVNNKNYFEQIRGDISLNSNVFIIFEVVWVPNEKDESVCFENLCDHVNAMYLRVLSEILLHNKIEHAFLLIGEAHLGAVTEIQGEEYFRLRRFLSLCSEEWNNRFFVRYRYSNKASIRVARLLGDDRIDSPAGMDQASGAGKILPLIDISSRTYNIFVDDISNPQVYSSKYYSVLESFKSKLLHVLSEYDIPVQELALYEEYDNFFELLLFVSTMYYIVEDIHSQSLRDRWNEIHKNEEKKERLSPAEQENVKADKKVRIQTVINRKELLHEQCADFAQGILQLVENALTHVVDSKEGGYANLCVRIRNRNKTVTLLSRENSGAGSYFMEVYVTDCSFSENDKWGIVEKFYDNINGRIKKVTDAEELSCLNDVLESRESEKDRIRIEQMFGIEESSILQKYLKIPQNVAHHYGLQILDNVILTRDGCLYVQSGNGKAGYYRTQKRNEFMQINFNWQHGTAYMIYLPIKKTGFSHISLMDTIAINDDGSHESIKIVKFPFQGVFSKVQEYGITYGYSEKEEEINRIIDTFNSKKGYFPQNVYIDCAMFHRCCQWELIAKIVFLCFANDILRNVGLINVNSKYEVIKVFRQFALFYNRQGENIALNDKSVFIVDKNAEMDILLKGPLSSIKENMSVNQIYGGLNKQAEKIIEYLGGR